MDEFSEGIEAKGNPHNMWIEKFHELSNEILTTLNSDIELKDIIDEVINLIQAETHYSAIGIRLRDGNDFPYFAQNGFPKSFLHKENTLLSKPPDALLCNHDAAPLECTCGLVITGNLPANNALFTKGGSFWTNNSLPILDIPTNQDPRFHPRNTCIHFHYLSIAIIPIKVHSKIIGTLQMNDKRENVFTDDIIAYFENICLSIGSTLLRKQTEILLKQKNEELEKLNQDKNKFFSIIAHDLRSPFNSIGALCQLLKEEVDSNNTTQAKEFANMIKELSDKANGLIKNLVDWSMSQTGKIVYNPVTFDLVTLIKDVVALYFPIATQKSISIIKILPVSLPVLGDSDMLATVLRNLFSNAIKFTHARGAITISVKKTIDSIEVSISDTGIGIPESAIENLFNIDNKYSKKGTQNEQGTGLGLVLCKEFIHNHGGKIWVESELGKGSNFIFTIPVQNNIHPVI